MERLHAAPVYLVFTDGWVNEFRDEPPIVECQPLTRDVLNPRLVVCAAHPPVASNDTVILYDRFSEGSWLPLIDRAEVGVIIGDNVPDPEPNVSPPSPSYWATVFATFEAAENAHRASHLR